MASEEDLAQIRALLRVVNVDTDVLLTEPNDVPTIGTEEVPVMGGGGATRTICVKERLHVGNAVMDGMELRLRSLHFTELPDLYQTLVFMWASRDGRSGFVNEVLTFDSHRAMLLAFVFREAARRLADGQSAAAPADSRAAALRTWTRDGVCLLGLGGGAIARTLASVFPEIDMDAVELDPAVVQLASKWFGFQASANVRVHTMCGLEYMRTCGRRFGVVLLDIESGADDMEAPPRSFISPEALQLTKACLVPTGVFVINIVIEREHLKLYNALVGSLRNVWNHVWVVRVDDANLLSFASDVEPPSDMAPDIDRLLVDTELDDRLFGLHATARAMVSKTQSRRAVQRSSKRRRSKGR